MGIISSAVENDYDIPDNRAATLAKKKRRERRGEATPYA